LLVFKQPENQKLFAGISLPHRFPLLKLVRADPVAGEVAIVQGHEFYLFVAKLTIATNKMT
jgi:hypothetical protein